MPDTRQRRHWIHIQLTDRETSQEAAGIIERWKRQRRATEHIIKAVQLYDDLLRGNTAVLTEVFPFLADSLNRGSPLPRPARPATPPVITTRERSEDEDISDLLDSF
jgi:hypothetical protein